MINKRIIGICLIVFSLLTVCVFMGCDDDVIDTTGPDPTATPAPTVTPTPPPATRDGSWSGMVIGNRHDDTTDISFEVSGNQIFNGKFSAVIYDTSNEQPYAIDAEFTAVIDDDQIIFTWTYLPNLGSGYWFLSNIEGSFQGYDHTSGTWEFLWLVPGDTIVLNDGAWTATKE